MQGLCKDYWDLKLVILCYERLILFLNWKPALEEDFITTTFIPLLSKVLSQFFCITQNQGEIIIIFSNTLLLIKLILTKI